MNDAPHPDPNLIALGIRQPWAELILTGRKSIEVRTVRTNIRDTIYLFAGKTLDTSEHAMEATKQCAVDASQLTRGKIVGSVEITNCRPCTPDDASQSLVDWEVMEGHCAWELANPVLFEEPLTIRFLPYGIWFYPFKRRVR